MGIVVWVGTGILGCLGCLSLRSLVALFRRTVAVVVASLGVVTRLAFSAGSGGRLPVFALGLVPGFTLGLSVPGFTLRLVSCLALGFLGFSSLLVFSGRGVLLSPFGIGGRLVAGSLGTVLLLFLVLPFC